MWNTSCTAPKTATCSAPAAAAAATATAGVREDATHSHNDNGAIDGHSVPHTSSLVCGLSAGGIPPDQSPAECTCSALCVRPWVTGGGVEVNWTLSEVKGQNDLDEFRISTTGVCGLPWDSAAPFWSIRGSDHLFTDHYCDRVHCSVCSGGHTALRAASPRSCFCFSK